MDIAFPALLIFLLVGPGFVFRELNQRREVRAAETAPFSRATLSALFYAVLINTIACLLVSFLGYEIRLGDLYLLLVQPDGLQHQQTLWQHDWNEHADRLLGYLIGIWLGAACVASVWREFASSVGLERPGRWLSGVFRGDAPWFYLLTGADHPSEVDGTFIAATVGMEGDVFLYQGLLANFELAADGKLDRLVLTQTSRRLLSNDRGADLIENGQRFYAISGDQFVLNYDQVSTLNISYLVLNQTI